MMDPTRFLFAGTDEINQAIQRLVEGPEFADIGTIERQVLKATREWMALREASAAYRGVTSAAWSRAFQTFSAETAKNPGLLQQGFRAVLDRWLVIANEELIRTQRTDDFLKAQRELLSAGVTYRLKERELVEVWCETHSIPTRTEVDDLHRTVHDLRRQVRDLSARLARPSAQPARATETRGRAGRESEARPHCASARQRPPEPRGQTDARADIPPRPVLARGRGVRRPLRPRRRGAWAASATPTSMSAPPRRPRPCGSRR